LVFLVRPGGVHLLAERLDLAVEPRHLALVPGAGGLHLLELLVDGVALNLDRAELTRLLSEEPLCPPQSALQTVQLLIYTEDAEEALRDVHRGLRNGDPEKTL